MKAFPGAVRNSMCLTSSTSAWRVYGRWWESPNRCEEPIMRCLGARPSG
jgi:hypothetical protein